MQPTPELLDHLYREKILVAKRMTPAERVRACFELTEFVRMNMTAGVRTQFPQATDEEVERILCQRVALVKKLHERR